MYAKYMHREAPHDHQLTPLLAFPFLEPCLLHHGSAAAATAAGERKVTSMGSVGPETVIPGALQVFISGVLKAQT